jgi:hypothetical protein
VNLNQNIVVVLERNSLIAGKPLVGRRRFGLGAKIDFPPTT